MFRLFLPEIKRITLRQWMEDKCPLRLEKAYPLMIQILRILNHLHTRNYIPPGLTPDAFYIHRDSGDKELEVKFFTTIIHTLPDQNDNSEEFFDL
ncbi:MAG: hypothetical protein JXJ04_22210 [Spirochaetales bacterium]|nr:hypothetical protein [Spirochaetales bacterium]